METDPSSDCPWCSVLQHIFKTFHFMESHLVLFIQCLVLHKTTELQVLNHSPCRGCQGGSLCFLSSFCYRDGHYKNDCLGLCFLFSRCLSMKWNCTLTIVMIIPDCFLKEGPASDQGPTLPLEKAGSLCLSGCPFSALRNRISPFSQSQPSLNCQQMLDLCSAFPLITFI